MKWYNIYSYWVIILVILSYLQIIKFSVIPSVIIALVGSIILYIAKLYLHIPVNIPIMIYMFILHIIPFLLLPIQYTKRDLYINILIVLLYTLFLQLQDLDIVKIYYNILHQKMNISVLDLLKNRGLYL